MRRRLVLLSVCLLLATGCGSLDVTQEGTIRTGIVEPACSTKKHPVVLAFNRLGHLTINGKVLDLPSGHENRYFGLGVVDVSGLPPVWRPRHATQGGVLVASLLKASPLAFAGLRPFDRIHTLNKAPVTGVRDLVARLELPHAGPHVLGVVKPGGVEAEIRARANRRVKDSNKNHVPLLFEHHLSNSGYSFGFGPLDLLFYFRVHKQHRYVESRIVGHSEYRDRFEWGVFGNLIQYKRERDPVTGKERSMLRLFGIPLGDDL